MNPDLLLSEFLGVTVRYDEIDLPRDDLAALFASVSANYDLPRFEYNPEGGATMSNPDGAEFVVRPGQAACGGVTRLGFHEGLERVQGLIGEAMERYDISQVVLDDVTLVATWDIESEEAGRQLLIDDVLRFDDERLALFGGDRDELSLGLRVWQSLGEGTVDCSIEPMHADPSRIYLRLVYSQRDVPLDLAGLLDAVEDVNRFLHGPVKSFMLAVARR